MFLRIIILFIFVTSAVSAKEYNILAIVGDRIITNYDLEQRIKIISLTSGRSFSGSNLAILKNQLLEVLVTEKIYILEAEKYNLLPNYEQINSSYTDLIKQNNYQQTIFEDTIKKYDIDSEAIKAQIKSELAWQNLIIYKLRSEIKINEFEIEDYLAEQENSDSFEYLAKILTFPINTNSNLYELEGIVKKIYNDVKKSEYSFSQIIKDFSVLNINLEEPIWKKLNEFDDEVQKYIPLLSKNELSKPIKSEENYYLVFIEDIRKVNFTKENKQDRDEIYRKLFLSKLEAVAESYIKNIKKSIYIEYKLKNGSI
ncbi:MAG: SurA N-terminal domain-containing protein [Rickettsiales bacterium]